MMYKVCRLLVVLFLAGLACAQADQQSKDPSSHPPPTVDPQARPAKAEDTWTCEVPVLQPSETPPHNRLPKICSNHSTRPRVITKVTCLTEQGSLVFQPELTGAGATSIVSQPLTCGPTWTEGVLNGQPRVGSFTKKGMNCASACTIDWHIRQVQGAGPTTLTISGEYE